MFATIRATALTRTIGIVTLSIAPLPLLLAGQLGAQRSSAPEQGAFLVRLGTDTTAAQRFTRTPTTLTAESFTRSPRVTLRRSTVTFDQSGRFTRLELTQRVLGGAATPRAMRAATLSIQGDSAVLEIQADSTIVRKAAVTPDVLPFFGVEDAISIETILRRASRAGGGGGGGGGGASVTIPVLYLGARQATPVTVRRTGADSVTIEFPEGLMHARVDAEGRLLGLDGRGSTDQITIERLPAIDIEAMGNAFASRAIASYSPRDTVRATIGGAALLVDYGRPAKRGRVIFGNVVPWDTWWRTGANAATTLVTDRDLVVGGTPVPRGTYTLFSIPSQAGWKLIVNKKTGEWGTDYDSTADLTRIDMQVTELAEPVEQFTITLEPEGAAGAGGARGVLRLAWDRTAASVPVEVK
jgi:hypothetical protein